MAKLMNCPLFLLHSAELTLILLAIMLGSDTVRDQVAAKFRQQHTALQNYSQQLRDNGIDCTALLAQRATVETVLNKPKN